MTRSGHWLIWVRTQFNLIPYFRCKIKFPKIIQFIVFIILSSKNVCFAIVYNRRMRCSNTWLIWTVLSDLFPCNCVSLFWTNETFIYSASFNKTSKNHKARVINYWNRKVVSRFWYISSLFTLGPCAVLSIEFINLFKVINLINTSKNYNGMSKYSSLMMWNLAWNTSFAINWLPTTTVFWIINNFMNSLNTHFPHIVHWSFFDVSSSVNVHAKLKILVYYNYTY